jgi:hypothetical protein
MELNEITEKVIGCAYKVLNTLGIGFLERVYENALAIEIQNAGLKVCLLINFGKNKIKVKRLVDHF